MLRFPNCIHRLWRMKRLVPFIPAIWGTLLAGEPSQPGSDYPHLVSPLMLNVPYDLRHLSYSWETGTVRLRIGPDGRVVDWIPIRIPHYKLIPALGRAFAEARFSPAILEGEAVTTDIPATISFSDLNVHTVVNETIAEHVESRQAAMDPRRNEVVLTGSDELDKPLQLVSSTPGYQVVDEEGNLVRGTVMVQFYIDTEGVPHLIRAEETADPVLAEAAVKTVEEFRFAPPTRRGYPAVAKARIPVVIGGEE